MTACCFSVSEVFLGVVWEFEIMGSDVVSLGCRMLKLLCIYTLYYYLYISSYCFTLFSLFFAWNLHPIPPSYLCSLELWYTSCLYMLLHTYMDHSSYSICHAHCVYLCEVDFWLGVEYFSLAMNHSSISFHASHVCTYLSMLLCTYHVLLCPSLVMLIWFPHLFIISICAPICLSAMCCPYWCCIPHQLLSSSQFIVVYL